MKRYDCEGFAAPERLNAEAETALYSIRARDRGESAPRSFPDEFSFFDAPVARIFRQLSVWQRAFVRLVL